VSTHTRHCNLSLHLHSSSFCLSLLFSFTLFTYPCIYSFPQQILPLASIKFTMQGFYFKHEEGGGTFFRNIDKHIRSHSTSEQRILGAEFHFNYEYFYLLRCIVALSVESQQTRRRDISHPRSGSKNAPSSARYILHSGSWLGSFLNRRKRRHVPPKRVSYLSTHLMALCHRRYLLV
jgi:hypothetical protein